MYKRYLLSMMLLSPCINANEYDDARKMALESLSQQNSGIEHFNLNEIPHFSNNPKEVRLKPSTKDELKEKAKALIEKDLNAKDLYTDAVNMQNQVSDKDTVTQSQETYQSTQNSKINVECDDGRCIDTGAIKII